jgi:hypothetical protein
VLRWIISPSQFPQVELASALGSPRGKRRSRRRGYRPESPSKVRFSRRGRNIIRGGVYHSANLSLFRNFALRERVHLQLRFEAENAFNQVNFQGPITDQTTTPGLFVAAAPPRIVQLGAKISF